MKQRFTYLDIRAIANELNASLSNSYIQQIYTPTPHIFIFKTSNKQLTLFEPGIRIHPVSSYTSTMTFFMPKIRILKHNVIKSISQVGFDRIIKIVTNKFTVYLEFFANGNIIITEDNLIKEVYRPVKELKIVKGEIYVYNEVSLEFSVEKWIARGMREMVGGDKIVCEEILKEVKREMEKVGFENVDLIEMIGKENFEEKKKDILEEKKNYDKIENNNGNKSIFKEKIFDSKIDNDNEDILEENKIYDKIENNKDNEIILKEKNFDSKIENNNDSKLIYKEKKSNFKLENKTKSNNNVKTNEVKKKIHSDSNKKMIENKDQYLKEFLSNKIYIDCCNTYFKKLQDEFNEIKNFGVLIYKKDKPNNFFPLKITNIENIKEFDSFGKALQVYFEKKEEINIKKSCLVKERQEKRIYELEESIYLSDKKVEAIYENEDIIKKICLAHKNVIDYNIDWKNFEAFKTQEKELRDYIIKSDFINKKVILKLESIGIWENDSCDENNHEEVYSETSEEERRSKCYFDFVSEHNNLKDFEYAQNRTFEIEFNFMDNINNNINSIYDQKKKLKEKLKKTMANLKSVVKKVEKKDSKKAIKKEKIIRKTLWYEKFHYFFTSTNKLIIAGKNAQQNDILVKKYLTKNDLYFHAEVQGGSSVILLDGNKNKNDEEINEAGLMALCLSNAWKGKTVVNVYYVESDQVSKTTETGEFIKTGGFMVRGKKNYVEAFRLEYGIGILFKLGKNEEGEEGEKEGDEKDENKDKNNLENKGEKEVEKKGECKNNFKNEVEKCNSKIEGDKSNFKNDLENEGGKNGKLNREKGETEDKSIKNKSTIGDGGKKLSSEKEKKDNIENNEEIEEKSEEEDKKQSFGRELKDEFNKLDILSLKNEASFNFTSNPKENENLEHALLICGPWKVLKNYKYNCKLLPGSDKKGKIVSEIMKKFIKQSNHTQENNLIRNLTVEEYNNILISNCKLAKVT